MAQAAGISTAQRSGKAIPILFTVTIFTSALLLFFVQPLFTRMVLPNIGGAAAVWTTAMLFFQTVLIGGYLYAHLMTKHVPIRLQIGVHICLLLLALIFLPLTVPADWTYDPARPVVTQTLWLYTISVGLPFAVLSANAPLIQSWYRQSGGPSANDPYFLYAASNLGSLIALLAFPLVAEPLWGIKAISGAWSIGFMALGPLLLLSGLMARSPVAAVPDQSAPPVAGRDLTPATLAYWAFLAFIPSSLMLCVTSKISTDLGSFPLVWVIPLALYLLTFVFAFSNRSPMTAERLYRLLPVALAVLVFFSLRQSATLMLFAVLLAAFFVVGMTAHRVLFEARPDARHLTAFYLTMSVGGALGGLFNSIFAPLVFDRMLEYPITLVLAGLLMVRRPLGNLPRALATGLFLGFIALLPLVVTVPLLSALGAFAKTAAVTGLLLLIYAAYRVKPVVPVTALATIVGIWAYVGIGNLILSDRSFFGLHVVKNVGDMRVYSNGTTLHGAQLIAESGDRPTPLTYYHPKGLMAEVVNMERATPVKSVGIVGLGTGALACYSKPGQDWHFYEIDQKVVDIALDPKLFSFMTDCAPNAKIHLGDARIVLQGQEGLTFDTLVLDAYSSDAIPMHLTTVEAFQLYLDRLNPDGLLIVHVSNRFYDLAKPLAVAADALGLVGRVRGQGAAEIEMYNGAIPSNVVVLARSEAALGALATDPLWKPLPEPSIELWTDDHADLLKALR